MTSRSENLDRIISLVLALASSSEGMTIDDIAQQLHSGRRTAERVRDIIAMHFDLEHRQDGAKKRFYIRDGLIRNLVPPTCAKLAALESVARAHMETHGNDQSRHLKDLSAKLLAYMNRDTRRRMGTDLDILHRSLRTWVPAGPQAVVVDGAVATIENAILAARCVEFDYIRDGDDAFRHRCVIPYGLVAGPHMYLAGKLPDDERPPVYYRLDRMQDVRESDVIDAAPEDFDFDDWISKSFGFWRDEGQEVVLRILPHAADVGRNWRFHPGQTLENCKDGGLRVRFHAGGLRELAEHLFTWGGDLIIETPQALRDEMRDRIQDARMMLMLG